MIRNSSFTCSKTINFYEELNTGRVNTRFADLDCPHPKPYIQLGTLSFPRKKETPNVAYVNFIASVN